MVLYLITKGPVYFCNDTMSCYRTNSIGSFKNRREKDDLLQLRHSSTLIDGIAQYNEYTGKKYDEIIKAYIVIQLENLRKIEERIFKTYEPYYFKAVYQGKWGHVRYFIRRKMPYLYKLLLWGWKKLKNERKVF